MSEGEPWSVRTRGATAARDSARIGRTTTEPSGGGRGQAVHSGPPQPPVFGTLLRLQLVAFRRAPYFGGRLALTVLKSLGLAYAVAASALMGFLLPDTLSVVMPGLSAMSVVERALLPSLVLLTVARVLFQDVPTRGTEAFLLLPVRRERVAATVLVRSTLSVLNAVPLLFVIPFAARTVRAEAGAPNAVLFVAGAAVLVLLSHMVMVVWKTRLGERPLQTIVGLGAALAAVAALDVAVGGLVSHLRGAGGVAITVGLAALVLAIAAWAYRGIVEALYLDRTARRRAARPAPTTGFQHAGARAFLELDVRQLARTRYPRGIVVNAAVLGVALSLIALLGDGGDPMALLMVFAVSSVAVSAGQFALPFASGHYDRLLTLPGTLPAFVRAKLAFSVASVGLLATLQLVLVAGLAPSGENVLRVATGVLFGSGVLAPVAILGSSIAPKPLDVGDRVMMNYKVQSFAAQVVIGGVSLLAAGVFVGLGPRLGLATLAGAGAVGVLALPLWERVLVSRLAAQRHAISARFRATL